MVNNKEKLHIQSIKPIQCMEKNLYAFEKQVVGYVFFDIQAQHESPMTVYYGESHGELWTQEKMELSYFKFPKDQWHISPGHQQFKSKGRRAFQYIRIECEQPIKVDITVKHGHYPVRDRSKFNCSDPRLDQIYETAKYTTKLCMQDYYEDGIKRDGLLWIGDARVEALINYYAFGDFKLAKKCLDMFQQTQKANGSMPACAIDSGGHIHPEHIEYMPTVKEGVRDWTLYNYCTDYVSMLKEYYWYSKDEQTLQQHYETAKKIMMWLYEKTFTEKFDPNAIITDEDTNNRNQWWASKTTYLCQLLWALKDLDQMANTLKKEGWQPWIKQTQTYVMENCFDQDKKVFRDGENPSNPISQHANAFALLAGMETKENPLQIARKIKDVHYPIAGFMQYYVHEALFQSGHIKEALNDMHGYYGFMLANKATTFWEKLDRKHPDLVLNNPVVSRCHGWSGGPACQLPAYVLGVKPTSPGWQTIYVKPNLLDLTFAEGNIPTPHGDIRIQWENDGQQKGKIVVPKNIEIEKDPTIDLSVISIL